jgi:hypothetical protein
MYEQGLVEDAADDEDADEDKNAGQPRPMTRTDAIIKRPMGFILSFLPTLQPWEFRM